MKKIIVALILLSMLLSSCVGNNPQINGDGSGSDDTPVASDSADGNTSGDGSTGSTDVDPETVSEADLFSSRDLEGDYNKSKSILISLSGESAFTTNSTSAVRISGSTVTIAAEGTYILRGSLDGMIIVDVDKTEKVQLVLDGASITSQASAAIYVREADKVFITLTNGSENSLSSGDRFEAIDEYNIDSTVFSRADLTINGSGKLTVDSPAGHGIVCKDDIAITGGDITVNSASHGIQANDSVRFKDATLKIDSGKDGIQVENTDDPTQGFFHAVSGNITINAEGDGISAGTYATLSGGVIEITAGGGYENGEQKSSSGWGGFMGGRPGSYGSTSSSSDDSDGSTSMKGIKVEGDLTVTGGNITIDSADDALHANGSLTVSGGVIEIASGDDALHAEENLTVSGGTITITESYEGLEALHITVSGGDIKLKATDDGLNAAGGNDSSGTEGGRDGMFGGRPGGFGGMGGSSNGSITISGGNLYINSSGDGIDANGTLEITGGYTVITGPTQGDTATLDFDNTGVISGGTFIGTGASGMAQTFSSSENQGVIAVSVGSQAAGTRITLTDSKGNVVIDHSPELSFAVVILSSPDIKKGEAYTITVGSASGEFTAE